MNGAELALLFSASPLPTPPTEIVPLESDLQPVPESAALLSAIQLRPADATSYQQLAGFATSTGARARLLEHAHELRPRDTALRFAVANAQSEELQRLMSTPNRSRGEGSEESLRRARRDTLAALRRAAATDEGAFSPSTHSSLGAVLYQMGRRDESVASFHRACQMLPLLRPLLAELRRKPKPGDAASGEEHRGALQHAQPPAEGALLRLLLGAAATPILNALTRPVAVPAVF